MSEYTHGGEKAFKYDTDMLTKTNIKSECIQPFEYLE